jgi:ribosomal protein S18 acetylase RimI-like enzyme
MQQIQKDVQVVDARPEHAPFIAWVMRTAARSHLPKGIWDFMAGPDEQRVLAYLDALASTPEPHFAHYSLFIVAEVDGKPAAALEGYFEEENGSATIAPHIPAAAKAIGADHDALMAQFATGGGASMLAVMPKHEPRAWIVEHVATHPDFRRQGLIDRLLAAIIEKGRSRGATIADVGVLIGNDGAQRAYEKAGFRVVENIVSTDFEAAYGCPGLRELSRSI